MITYSVIKKSQLEGAHRLDAEYFMPEFLNVATHLDQISSAPLETFGKITASAFYPAATAHYSKEVGLPFIRVVDIVNYPIIDESQQIEKLPEDFIKNCSGITTLKNGEMVVSKVGTPCYASIINGNIQKVALTRTVLGIKNICKINPFYLLAFLRSKYGFYQLMREREQQIQLQLTLDRVRKIKIFVPSQQNQDNIANIVLEFYKTQKQSDKIYSQAEDLLLQELGLKDFKIEDDLAYVVNLSDVKSAHRADAEYFQPKYQRVVEKVKKHSVRLLGDLVSIKKGGEPGSDVYQDEGKLFIRVSSVSKHGIIDKDQKYLSDELYQILRKLFEPKIGEILLTKDATPGIAYVLKESVEGIIAGGVTRLKLKEDIEAEYLALCINSVIGQMQIERDAGGSVILHWKPDQIKNLQVPILPKPTQQKIADLVRQSHEACKTAKELLEKAKREVEKLIEDESYKSAKEVL